MRCLITTKVLGLVSTGCSKCRYTAETPCGREPPLADCKRGKPSNQQRHTSMQSHAHDSTTYCVNVPSSSSSALERSMNTSSCGCVLGRRVVRGALAGCGGVLQQPSYAVSQTFPCLLPPLQCLGSFLGLQAHGVVGDINHRVPVAGGGEVWNHIVHSDTCSTYMLEASQSVSLTRPKTAFMLSFSPLSKGLMKPGVPLK